MIINQINEINEPAVNLDRHVYYLEQSGLVKTSEKDEHVTVEDSVRLTKKAKQDMAQYIYYKCKNSDNRIQMGIVRAANSYIENVDKMAVSNKKKTGSDEAKPIKLKKLLNHTAFTSIDHFQIFFILFSKNRNIKRLTK